MNIAFPLQGAMGNPKFRPLSLKHLTPWENENKKQLNYYPSNSKSVELLAEPMG